MIIGNNGGHPQLILSKDDLRIIGELTASVMVPASVQGLLTEPYKYTVAIRSLFIKYDIHPPYDVVITPYNTEVIK